MPTQNQHSEVWQRLFDQALTLIDDIALRGYKDIFWTFGGGTVLMLRFNHRKNRQDIKGIRRKILRPTGS